MVYIKNKYPVKGREKRIPELMPCFRFEWFELARAWQAMQGILRWMNSRLPEVCPYTSHSWIAFLKDATLSAAAGINSWATYPLYPVSTMAFIIAG